MMENHRPLTSLDGASNRNTPERCPRPLYSQDHTEENHSVPQEGQDKIFSNIKVEDIKEEEETYVTDIKADNTEREEEAYVWGDQYKPEEIPTGISTYGASNRNTLERCPRPLYSQYHTEENHSLPQGDQDEAFTVIKVEDMTEEEQMYVRGDQQYKKWEVPTGFSTDMSQELSEQDYWTGFIELYRANECLWKVRSKDYANKVKKTKAYQQLIDYCKGRNSQADMRWVKKKIQNFRTVFLKEHKRVKESQRSRAGANEVRRPSLWYYNLLMFTLDQDPKTSSTYSMMMPTESPEVVGEETAGSGELLAPSDSDHDPPISEHGELEIFDVDPSSPPPSPPPTRRRRVALRPSNSGESRSEQFLRCAEQVLQKPPDEHVIFGMNIANELQVMDPLQRLRFKSIVYDALICAENGRLPENPILPSQTLHWTPPPAPVYYPYYPAYPPPPVPPPHQPPTHASSRAPSHRPTLPTNTSRAQTSLQADQEFF